MNIDQDVIFVIGGWINSTPKKDHLIKNIGIIRDFCKSDILFVTHFPIPVELQNSFDYYLFDKRNPILSRDEIGAYDINQYGWFANNLYIVFLGVRFQQDYAIWLNWRHSFNFASYLGKENIVYLEADTVLDQVFFNNIVLPLDKYKYCRNPWSKSSETEDAIGSLYSTNFFSFRTSIGKDVTNDFDNRDAFFTHFREYPGRLRMLEHIFNQRVTRLVSSSDIFDCKENINALNHSAMSDDSFDHVTPTENSENRSQFHFCSQKSIIYLFVIWEKPLSQKVIFTLTKNEVQYKENVVLFPQWNFIVIDKIESIGDFEIQVEDQIIYRRTKEKILEDIKYGTVIFQSDHEKDFQQSIFKDISI